LLFPWSFEGFYCVGEVLGHSECGHQLIVLKGVGAPKYITDLIISVTTCSNPGILFRAQMLLVHLRILWASGTLILSSSLGKAAQCCPPHISVHCRWLINDLQTQLFSV
jgi:hypothetical protein